jgi:hypothetical protein
MVVVLTFVFAVLLLFAAPSMWAEKRLDFLILVMAFGLSLVAAVFAILLAFVQFAQRFYGLDFKEAGEFVYRLVFGLPDQAPKYPVLSVREGRKDPDGPTQLLKIGGPGFLNVDHDSAVVTARAGKIKRVLGPGFHTLEPFESVWDVVDLRPQHRELKKSTKVEFMTRDGLPAYCEAEIGFRIDGGGQAPTEQNPFPFTEDAIRSVTDIKRMKGWDKDKRKRIQQDWTQRVAFGILDGEIRNRLEMYNLDELLHPQKAVQNIQELQQEIEATVKQSAAGMGVKVDRVRLSPVQPSEEAVSKEWLRIWQAGLQRDIDNATTEGKARYAAAVEDARIQATAKLINDMVNQVNRIHQQGGSVPPDVVVLSFLNILRSMAENDPDIQPAILQQARNLQDIIRGTPINPFPGTPSAPAAETDQSSPIS